MIGRDAIAKLFAVGLATYGTKWSASFGLTDERDIWLHDLAHFDTGDLRAAWESCKLASEHAADQGREVWPPTLPEIVAACRRHHTKAPEHQRYLSPPMPEPISREEAHQVINRLRATLGLAPKYPAREPGSDDDLETPERAA